MRLSHKLSVGIAAAAGLLMALQGHGILAVVLLVGVVVVLAREITVMSERQADSVRRANEAQSLAVEQLRHSERLAMVGRLASGIAHELGTPLNVVSLRARMIAEGESQGEEARASGLIIAQQTQRIINVIEQLLAFARGPAAGQLLVTAQDQIKAQDLREAVRGSMNLIAPIAEKRRVLLHFVDPAEPVPARVNPGQIEQILLNLLLNAIQASGDSGRVEISIETVEAAPPDALPGAGAPLQPCIVIHVRDAGKGIDPANLPHIFEPFFTTKGVGEGTGLGLSVSYGIVRDLGGWLGVQSVPGQGSTFSIYLPVVGLTPQT